MRATFLCAVGFLLMLGLRTAIADDFRVWADSTGRNKMEGKFISLQEGTVTLETKEGKKFDIKLEKLSKADQAFVKQQEDNPFQASKSDNPFMPAGEGKGNKEKSDGPPERVKIDLDRAQSLSTLNAPDWKYAPAAGTAPPARLKNVPLPKRADIFDKLTHLSADFTTGMVVGGLTHGRPAQPATTRIFLGNLKDGRVTTSAPIDGEYLPLAIHPNGTHVLVRKNEFGFHGKEELQLCRVEGTRLVVEKICSPYQGEQFSDVRWAAFFGDQHFATLSNGGILLGWNLETLQPTFSINIDRMGTPARSPDRRTLACYGQQNVLLIDVPAEEITGMIQTPRTIPTPVLAFSPSGERIACAGTTDVLIWDGKDGSLQRDLKLAGISVSENLGFTDEKFLLIGKSILFDTESEIPLWNYQGVSHSCVDQGWVILAGNEQNSALYAVQLPHQAAEDLLKEVLTKPERIAFKKGDPVDLDVSGIPGEHQAAVREVLVKRLSEAGTRLSSVAPVKLVATIEGPTSRTMNFMHAGNFQVSEYLSKVELKYQDQRAWGTSGTNIPAIVTYKRSENLNSKLQELSQKPNLTVFERLVLPKVVIRPTAGQRNTGIALGSSHIDRK